MRNFTLVVATVFFITASIAQSTATYSVTFMSNWSQTTHPHPSGDIPSNAHWSKLVGATHNDQISFLRMGNTATPGVEDVAEAGVNTTFFSEINEAITNGSANLLIDGPGLSTANGEIEINNIETTEDFPLLTLVSMIAPSPDWIVAISGIELLDGDGDWKDSITLDLFPYDAGTDNGIDYASVNSDTNPKENISNLQGTTPFSNETIGTITITLEGVVLGINEIQLQEVSIYPNPTNSIVTVSSSNNAFKQVSIYNVLGKKIINLAANGAREVTLDLSSLSSGVYILQTLDSKNNRTSKKVVKR